MRSSISLCLACSSSLPPRKAGTNLFHTRCCSQPICPTCISKNPRLTRYDPCLRCLAGIKAVNSRYSEYFPAEITSGEGGSRRMNIDGAVLDEDIFVVFEDVTGSETDEDISDTLAHELHTNAHTECTLEPSVTLHDQPSPRRCNADLSPSSSGRTHTAFSEHVERTGSALGAPSRYFIKPDDTLLGISFKLGIDSRILCRLNYLPYSTLRVTPHLLHTRSFLILPPSTRPTSSSSAADQAQDDEKLWTQLAVERAQTRFQALTKETDRDVAKAYVALAGLHDNDSFKEREKEQPAQNGLRRRGIHVPDEHNLEGRAMDRYFDDDEWETHERAEGRKADIPSFPYFSGSSRVAHWMLAKEEEKTWWRWRS